MIHIFPKLRWSYIRKNVQSVIFLWSFIAINATLFATRVLSYVDHWPYGALARANGQSLNFCCAAILLCVLRRSITYLRSVGFSKFLPLDHHIYYHKVIGWTIVFASVFHTAMHVLNFNKLSKITSIPLCDYLYATYLGIGWIGGLACITGWVLLIILAIIMIPAQPFMRRSGKFEVFYYTHHLYLLFYAIMFIHAPHFWLWFIGPGFLFMTEAILRVAKSFGADHGLTYIEQGIILPSRVIQLIIKRPPNFEYHPGDYVYVQIPAITKYEWHPLTISSAPEQEGVLWLHVRVVGEWTHRLYNYFATKERNTPLKQNNYDPIPLNSPTVFNTTFSSSDSDLNSTPVHSGAHPILTRKRSTSIKSRQLPENARIMLLPVPVDCNEFGCGKEALKAKQRVMRDIEMAPSPISKSSFESLSRLRSPLTKNEPYIYKSATILAKPLRVRLDGPYGTPSSHIFHTQHAVLIATGIGVTPFASILQSIMLRYIDAKRICPNCAHSWSDPILSNVMKLKKVDFMWINRDQKHFEWFVSLLSELHNIQKELVDRFLDIHAHLTSETDTTADTALDDSYTFGLKLRKGRPDWHRFFKDISAQKMGKITVYFCGNADLARHLRSICTSYGFEFKKEVF